MRHPPPLVRALAFRQRMLHSSPVSITHVGGKDNNLADIASRSITHLDDNNAFLTHFDNVFPLQARFRQRASPRSYSLALASDPTNNSLQRWDCFQKEHHILAAVDGNSTHSQMHLRRRSPCQSNNLKLPKPNIKLAVTSR